MDVSIVDVKIQNVVATANLYQRLDLVSIMKTFRNVEYRPKRFPGLVFRLKRPKTATLIFRTGKMVCTGAKSEKMALRAVKKVVRDLKKAGIIILRNPEIIIQNIVSTADMGGRVDLEGGAYVMENVMYEPEQFPGLIYRMAEPNVVILLFNSGKTVITGAKTMEETQDAAERTVTLLRDKELIYSRG